MATSQFGKNAGKIFLGLGLLVVAAGGLWYWSLVREMDRAENDYSQGDAEAALGRYENVEKRLQAVGILRFIPARDRQNLILNQARLLYVLNRFDEAADRLERENELVGQTSDGRFFFLRGNIAFRNAVFSYQESQGNPDEFDDALRDLTTLDDTLRRAEDSLRESLRLNPNQWDAKFNLEFVDVVRRALTAQDQEKVELLIQEEEEKPQPKDLPPERAG